MTIGVSFKISSRTFITSLSHSERKRLKMVDNDQDELTDISRKLSYISSTMENGTNPPSISDIISMDTSKIPEPEVEQTISDQTTAIFSIRKIYKNLISLSVAFVLLFTAHGGITMLQSSLNVKNNVGVNSLTITHAFVMAS